MKSLKVRVLAHDMHMQFHIPRNKHKAVPETNLVCKKAQNLKPLVTQ